MLQAPACDSNRERTSRRGEQTHLGQWGAQMAWFWVRYECAVAIDRPHGGGIHGEARAGTRCALIYQRDGSAFWIKTRSPTRALRRDPSSLPPSSPRHHHVPRQRKSPIPTAEAGSADVASSIISPARPLGVSGADAAFVSDVAVPHLVGSQRVVFRCPGRRHCHD